MVGQSIQTRPGNKEEQMKDEIVLDLGEYGEIVVESTVESVPEPEGG